jgi:hypothetical protein
VVRLFDKITKALPGKLRNEPPRTIVQGFWYGDPIPPLNWACLNSFLDNGLGFDLYAYQELAVPNGVRLRDAAEIVPKEEMFFFANPHTRRPDVAPFVDYFRLLVLHRHGGWWCDVDTICRTGALPLGERAWSRQSPEYRPESVSNGQLHFEKGDSLLEVLIEEARQLRSNYPRRESLGPELLSSVLKRMALPLDMGATADTFYPIRFIEAFKLWLPEFRDEVKLRTRDAVFVPVFQSFPTRFGLANDKLPPKRSYLGRLMKKHAPDITGPAHNAAAFRSAVRQWFKANPIFIGQLRAVSPPGIEGWLDGVKPPRPEKTTTGPGSRP